MCDVVIWWTTIVHRHMTHGQKYLLNLGDFLFQKGGIPILDKHCLLFWPGQNLVAIFNIGCPAPILVVGQQLNCTLVERANKTSQLSVYSNAPMAEVLVQTPESTLKNFSFTYNLLNHIYKVIRSSSRVTGLLLILQKSQHIVRNKIFI